VSEKASVHPKVDDTLRVSGAVNEGAARNAANRYENPNLTGSMADIGVSILVVEDTPFETPVRRFYQHKPA
jgi:hypothetical protein